MRAWPEAKPCAGINPQSLRADRSDRELLGVVGDSPLVPRVDRFGRELVDVAWRLSASPTRWSLLKTLLPVN